MRTLRAIVAYDGTDFAGWQRQATDRTVQAAIEDALAPFEGRRVVVIGAGRTDAGVHAAGQVASFSLTAAIRAGELQRALNATLPPDVRVLRLDEAADAFNAQFDARCKTYRYWLWSEGVLPPQLRRYMWHVPQRLDPDVMTAAAASLIGAHDFAAFQASGSDVITTVREVSVSQVTALEPASAAGSLWPAETPGPAASGGAILYEITASGFLRHMVRNIVGTLVDIGRGRRATDEIGSIMASRDRAQASATAPPHGLTLWKVEY